MDMFSVFSLVDDYIIIVNSRLVAPKLGVQNTTQTCKIIILLLLTVVASICYKNMIAIDYSMSDILSMTCIMTLYAYMSLYMYTVGRSLRSADEARV
jgi:hypothetical protein